MNIDILHRPTALENLLADRIWPAGRRLPMHALNHVRDKKLTGSSQLACNFNSLSRVTKL